MSPTIKRWSIIFKVSNLNLVKGNDYSDSDILTYASVKDYSFGGYVIRPYTHTPVHLNVGLFQLKLVYS